VERWREDDLGCLCFMLLHITTKQLLFGYLFMFLIMAFHVCSQFSFRFVLVNRHRFIFAFDFIRWSSWLAAIRMRKVINVVIVGGCSFLGFCFRLLSEITLQIEAR